MAKPEPGINVFGLLDSPTGVGEAARGTSPASSAWASPCTASLSTSSTCSMKKPCRRNPIETGDQLLPRQRRLQRAAAVRVRSAALQRTIQHRLLGMGTRRVSLHLGRGQFLTTRFWVPTAFVQQAVAARMRVPCRSHTPLRPDRQIAGERPGGLQSAAGPAGHPLHVRHGQYCRPQEPDGGHRGGRAPASPARIRSSVIKAARTDLRARTGWPPPQTIQTRRVSNRRGLAQPPADPEPDRRVRHVPLAAPIRGVRPDPRRSDGPGKTGSGHRLFGKHGFMNQMNSFPVNYKMTTLKET